MARRKPVEPEKKTLGALTDELWAQRERKRELAKELKSVEDSMESIQSELIERMEAEGLDSAKGKMASITVTPSLQPQIEDWDAVCAFIKKTGNWQLIRRQLNPEPWRELMATKTGVPGSVSFVKKTLNTRSL